MRAGNNFIDFEEFLALIAVRSQHRHDAAEVLEAFQVGIRVAALFAAL